MLLAAAASCAQASSLEVCDPPDTLSVEQKDRLFRFGALVKSELEASGARLALVSRSGLDLARFGQRYSHAGYSLRDSPETPWAVRQLYYACDEQQPRIFDQGLLAFVLGMNEPALGYISVVLLPPAASAAVERAALDKRLALQMLAGRYSANAYPFSTLYQNCNQWVLELLAAARGGLAGEGPPTVLPPVPLPLVPLPLVPLRQQAQAWLQAQGYEPTVFEVGSRLLMWAGRFVRWLHDDDHPAADLDGLRYRVSMPPSIEAFVQRTVPGATRLEFCHTERHLVVHRGWTPVAEGCVPAEGDTVIALQEPTGTAGTCFEYCMCVQYSGDSLSCAFHSGTGTGTGFGTRRAAACAGAREPASCVVAGPPAGAPRLGGGGQRLPRTRRPTARWRLAGARADRAAAAAPGRR